MSTFMQQPKPEAPKAPGYSDKQFLHTHGAAVYVPLAQSAVAGVIVFALCVILALVLDAIDPFTLPLVAGGFTLAWSWWRLQTRWLRLTDLEQLFRADFNGDGVIGKAEPRIVKVHISQVKEDGHYQGQMIDLPATDEQMQALAHGFKMGQPFSERNWTGAGKPFSVNEFRALRSVMIQRDLLGLASAKDPRQGYALTETGRAMMDEMAAV